MIRFAILAALVVCSVAPGSVQAQSYPSRAVTIVVPFAAGGGSDLLARLVAKNLEERLGKPFIIENRPGAGTTLAAMQVVRAEPDGYTLMQATSSTMAINVTMSKKLPYEPLKDLVPVALLSSSPFFLVVSENSPIKSVKELIEIARAKPNSLNYGSGGPGSMHHLSTELLLSLTGIQMTHVPYKGSLPALNDVVAGHIQLMFCDIPPAAGMIAAGKVRAIGVSIKERLAAFPQVPTVDEAGVAGFDVAGWFMIAAPGDTPGPVVDKLHGELKSVLTAADMKEQIAKLSLLPMDDPPVDDMRKFVASEVTRWGKVVAQAGIAGSE
jgi:tripartite-type tricarboxylate transporter receptor subunit TctC